MRQILHIDMDAFYASVEQRDDPALRGIPVVVGGGSNRGVVAAASYEAREFGVYSAMPMVTALRRCPEAVVIPPRMARYAEVSARVFAVFRAFTPLVQGLSLDEAFLDVTASRGLFGDGEAIARRIQAEVFERTGLTASAGIARCKFVAKIASDLEKPRGTVVAPEDEAAFLAPMPIERMWGVGAKTAPKLRALGLFTLGDLAKADPAWLVEKLGNHGAGMRALALARDDRPVVPDRDAKSVGAERTYEEDLVGREAIERSLLAHAARVAARLVRDDVAGRAVVVKLKTFDHVLVSRRVTLPEPVADTPSIHAAACALLGRIDLRFGRYRLTGVSVEDLVRGDDAPTLFPDREKAKRKVVERLVVTMRDRFGDAGVTRATLLETEGSRIDARIAEATLSGGGERGGGEGRERDSRGRP